jgi:3-deoxy-D-manno-octulosonate 8-phosphate phosphatase (KDO 8-P phosphatase)
MKNKKTKELFKRVKLLVLDVDGVLTKGEIIYDNEGRELKIFNVKDGLGIYLLGRLGIKTVLLSARNSSILKKRAGDMGVAEVIEGVLPKSKGLTKIIKKYNVKLENICFVGDDLIDLDVMEKVGLGVAVKDAVASLKNSAQYVTKACGGQGAVREVVDLIISCQNLSDQLFECLKNPLHRRPRKG